MIDIHLEKRIVFYGVRSLLVKVFAIIPGAVGGDTYMRARFGRVRAPGCEKSVKQILHGGASSAHVVRNGLVSFPTVRYFSNPTPPLPPLPETTTYTRKKLGEF